jgi:hypothetical protein
MINVLLIRHGPTDWNVKGRIQGHTDVSLSAHGRAQVSRWSVPAEFRQYLWFASPLTRAMETARLLGAPDARPEPRLMEMSWGRWEGRTWEEIGVDNAERCRSVRYAGGSCDASGCNPRGVGARYWLEHVRSPTTSPRLVERTFVSAAGRRPLVCGYAQRGTQLMIRRAHVMCHVQHLMGSGHQWRTAAVSRALCARDFEVTYVSGGYVLPGLDTGYARFVQLPPARAADMRYRVLVDEHGEPVDAAWQARRRAL